MEKWKAVKGYEGIYEISNAGRLKVLLKYRKYRNHQERILNPSSDKDGYLKTILTNKDKLRKNERINRLVAINFIPNPKKKPCVNHKNGIKHDNRIENLEWVTVRENNIHAIKNGLAGHAGGEDHHMSKLKKTEVNQIIKMYSEKLYSQRELGDMFNISQTQISRIVNNKRWHQNTKRK